MEEKKINPVGAPTKYTNDIPLRLKEYFREIEPLILNGKEVGFILPTIERFCSEIDIVTSTFYKWCKEKPELSSAFDIAKQNQKFWLIQLANNGIYKEGFAKFTAVNLTDMRDRAENTVDQKTEVKLSYEV